MRLSIASLVLVALAAFFAACGSGASAMQDCRGTQLAGTFAVVPGSAGAGNIVYRLRLTNRSTTACFVTGLPQLQLRGKTGAKLPTNVQPAFRGGLTAILVRLQPGQSTRATARFSPDVPGPGEQTPGRCEPVAYTARVTAHGGGTTTVKITPPTSVCEHGRLSFSAYGR